MVFNGVDQFGKVEELNHLISDHGGENFASDEFQSQWFDDVDSKLLE